MGKTGVLLKRYTVTPEMMHVAPKLELDFEGRAQVELGKAIIDAISDGRTYEIRYLKKTLEEDICTRAGTFTLSVIVLLSDPRQALVGELVSAKSFPEGLDPNHYIPYGEQVYVIEELGFRRLQ